LQISELFRELERQGNILLMTRCRKICPQIIKNGSIHNGKQKYMCRECSRQFVENPANVPVSEEKKELINRLLPEKNITCRYCPGRMRFQNMASVM